MSTGGEWMLREHERGAGVLGYVQTYSTHRFRVDTVLG